jgi:hypothetical protein
MLARTQLLLNLFAKENGGRNQSPVAAICPSENEAAY